VTDTRFSHADGDPDGEGPGQPTPSDRLYRLAEADGYQVVGYDELLGGRDGGRDAAAVVRCGSSIALNPHLAGVQMRSEVLAMAIAVASTAPAGTVIVVSTERDPGAHRDANRVTTGMIATMLARQHGLETTSAAFRWYAVQ
jgi:hypothetical protein